MFKKKIISCILAFTVAVCSAASISAFATEGTYDLDSGETVSSEALTEGNVVIYNNAKYVYNSDNTFSYAGYNGEDTVVTVPDEVLGIPVTALDGIRTDQGESMSSDLPCNRSVQKIVLGKNVTRLGINDSYTGEDYHGWTETAVSSCRNLQSIEVSPDNEYFCSVNGVLFTKDMKTLVSFPAGRTGAYVIPEGVETIKDMAFQFSSVSNVRLPEGLKTIETNSFYRSMLDGIQIPSGVSVKDCAFLGSRLKTVVICPGTSDIGTGAFGSCKYLESITVPDTVVSDSFLLDQWIFGNWSWPDGSQPDESDKLTMYGFADSPAQINFADNEDIDFVVLSSVSDIEYYDTKIDWITDEPQTSEEPQSSDESETSDESRTSEESDTPEESQTSKEPQASDDSRSSEESLTSDISQPSDEPRTSQVPYISEQSRTSSESEPSAGSLPSDSSQNSENQQSAAKPISSDISQSNGHYGSHAVSQTEETSVKPTTDDTSTFYVIMLLTLVGASVLLTATTVRAASKTK